MYSALWASLRLFKFDPVEFVEPGARIESSLSAINKKAPERGLFIYGGEGGIRTPGPFRVNGFQDHRFRPLSHLSKSACIF
jgi:hypothetical protein